jgi:hypothetical protein
MLDRLDILPRGDWDGSLENRFSLSGCITDDYPRMDDPEHIFQDTLIFQWATTDYQNVGYLANLKRAQHLIPITHVCSISGRKVD